MLFRPHTPKKILGFRLPFTPGLFPKQRKELAQKIGQTFGRNVLTREALTDAAADSKIIDNIVDIFEKFVNKIVLDCSNLGEAATQVFNKKEDELRQIAKDKTQGIVNWVLENEKINDAVSASLAKVLVRFLERPSDYLAAEKILDYTKDIVLSKAIPYLKSGDFASSAADFAENLTENILISGKKLGDIVPPDIIHGLKVAAKSNLPRIATICRGLLRDVRVAAKLREFVSKVVMDNAGTFLGLFVKPDKIYNSIEENALKYLESQENLTLIYVKFCEYIDLMMEKDMVWLRNNLKPKESRKWLEQTLLSILGVIDEKWAENTFSQFYSKLTNWRELNLYKSLNLNEDFEHRVQDIMSTKFLPSIAESAKNAEFADKTVDCLFSLPLNQMLEKIPDFNQNLRALTGKIVIKLTAGAGEYVIGALNISQIIEEKINAFEIKEAERLVLLVMGRQLRWIAMLGGLLGFLIGFLPIIFNAF